MRTYLVRAVAVLSLASLAACGSDEAGSDKLDNLKLGMSRAEVLSAIGDGPMSASGSDSVRVVQGFRRMKYFIAGKSFEVIYLRDQPGDVREMVVQAVETPAVLGDDKLLGWGWKYYVGAMKEFGLPTPLMYVDSSKVAKPAMADSASKSAPTTPPPDAPAPSPAPKKSGA